MPSQPSGATLSPRPSGPAVEYADRDLSAALSDGDRAAFEQVYRRHHQEIYRYCLGITRNPGDAEDALQATMAAALRALPGEEREIAIRPWLFRVAHNESISLLRGRRNDVPEADDQIAGGSTTAERAEQREQLRELVADLGRLPERQRGALVMRELSDLSFKEIGAALGCSEVAARQTLFAARAALRDAAEGRAMDCELVQRAISDGDRRKLRGRKPRAHLAVCESCRDFRAAIDARSDQLQVLCPPLAAVAATSILSAIVPGASAGAAAGTGAGGTVAAGAGGATGGGGAGTAAAGSAAGGGLTGAGAATGALGAGVLAKGAAVVATVAIAAGAADASGVAELPGPFDLRDNSVSESAPPPADTPNGANSAAGKPGSDRAKGARAKGVAASTAKGANGKAKSTGKSKGKKGRGNGKPEGVGGGQPAAPPGGVKPEGVGGVQPESPPPGAAAPGPSGPSGGGGGGNTGSGGGGKAPALGEEPPAATKNGSGGGPANLIPDGGKGAKLG